MGGCFSRQAQPSSFAPGAASDRGQPQESRGDISHARFIVDNKGRITDDYGMDKKKLGEGSYGSVCKVTHKVTGATRALKSISKKEMKNIERFKQEIALMKVMDHPNIIKLCENYEDHRNIYLVMELCTGGELFDRIIEAGHFSEAQGACVVQQMFRALFYMHECHVCHRDLKPENFLFQSKEDIDKAMLKLIDFGLSCRFEQGQVLTTKAGTPYYVAPQVLSGKYDQLSDVWSVGVINYVMLCGYPPFFGETDAEVLSKVRLGNFSFNPADWKNISEDAKHLIRMCLKMNPKDRYTAEQALNHEWIKHKAPKAKDVTISGGLVANLKGFRAENKLKKAALHVIATQLNEAQIQGLRDVFVQLDKNGDGILAAAEMKEGLEKVGLKDVPPDMQEILKGVDADASGQIDYTEFLAATLDRRMYLQKETLWAAFRLFDRNGDGFITQEELRQVLKDDVVAEMFGADALAGVDTNGDGRIDFEEFAEMMHKTNDA